MARPLPLVLLLAACLLFNANTYGFTASHTQGDPGEDALGTVHFSTSCSAEVQPQFNRAIALLHSFWFQAAIDAFEEVLEVDSSCGISYWGIALATWGNPIGSGAN